MYSQIYKNLVFINLGVIFLAAIKSTERYLAGDLDFLQIDYYFIFFFILSLVLLVLMNKKLIIAAFYVGCLATVTLTIFLFNKLLPVTEYYSSFTNEFLLGFLTIVHSLFIALTSLIFYSLISGYLYRVLMKVKRLKSIKT